MQLGACHLPLLACKVYCGLNSIACNAPFIKAVAAHGPNSHDWDC